MDQLAEEWVVAKHGGRAWLPHYDNPQVARLGPPNPARANFLRRQMDRLARLGGGSPDGNIAVEEIPWDVVDANAASDELIREANLTSRTPARLRRLRNVWSR